MIYAPASRLSQLRQHLSKCEVEGFLVPCADEHQGEYRPDCEERLFWLTGFQGSAGWALVLPNMAAIFVDGRYTLQVKDQVDLSLFTPISIEKEARDAWLLEHVQKGWRIGYDPMLYTPHQLQALRPLFEKGGATLVPLTPNPIDLIWEDRPPPPLSALKLHPLAYAGQSMAEKIQRVRAEKACQEVDGIWISDPHALAWLLNIRGGDIPHTPLVLAYAYLPQKGTPHLFIDPRKMTEEGRAALSPSLKIEPLERLLPFLKECGHTKAHVLFDQATICTALFEVFEKAGGKASLAQDPISLLKACKNETELRGARAAHLRDGIAMVRFLAFLRTHAPQGELTEISAAEQLEIFRKESGKLMDLSFPSISAFGPHAALPHYRASQATNLTIQEGIYLIDSGGQYEEGTTDITRTLVFGPPTQEMKDRYTRVLKGHIAIATSLFPKGTTGAQLDSFARSFLWQAGLDYDHGTGHGVGAYLSVHEGPQSLSKRGHTPLLAGMILSNEPGYYKPGHWGIRLESLLMVTPHLLPEAEHETFCFETLSLCPFDPALVDPHLLTPSEKIWLKAYHTKVQAKLTPHLPLKEKMWLEEMTRWWENVLTNAAH